MAETMTVEELIKEARVRAEDTGNFLDAETFHQLADALEAGLRVAKPFAEVSDTLHSGFDAGIAAGDHPTARVLVADLRALRDWTKGIYT